MHKIHLSSRLTSQAYELLAARVLTGQNQSIKSFLDDLLVDDLKDTMFMYTILPDGFDSFYALLTDKNISLSFRIQFLGWMIRRDFVKNQQAVTLENAMKTQAFPKDFSDYILSFGKDRTVSQLSQGEIDSILSKMDELDASFKSYKAFNPFALNMLKMKVSNQLPEGFEYDKEGNKWLFDKFNEKYKVDLSSFQVKEGENPHRQDFFWKYICSKKSHIEPQINKDQFPRLQNKNTVGDLNKIKDYRSFLRLANAISLLPNLKFNKDLDKVLKVLESPLWDSIERLAFKQKELEGKGHDNVSKVLKDAYIASIDGINKYIDGFDSNELIKMSSKLEDLTKNDCIVNHRGWKQFIIDVITSVTVLPILIRLIERYVLGMKPEQSMFYSSTHSSTVMGDLIKNCRSDALYTR